MLPDGLYKAYNGSIPFMLSKNKLGLSVFCAIVQLIQAQNVTPPKPIHQVQPEWGADLSQGYLEDITQVEMVVDPEGLPYWLKGTIPDNVVMALSQWRFEPGKKDGRPAPFSIVIKVPLRRTINPDIERSFGRRGIFLPKEQTDAIILGAELSAAGANEIQQSLAVDPKNLKARATLLAYYAATKNISGDETRKARLEQIAWLVKNVPESWLSENPLARINEQGDPLQDQSGYSQVRDLWLQQASTSPDNSNIIAHAADFLKVADPEKAIELRLAGGNKNTNAPSMLGEYYALAALGVTGLDLQHGLPATAAGRMPDTPFAQKARATLMSTNDASLLMGGLATVTIAGKSLAKTNHLPQGYSEFCETLLARAKQFQPAITTSCDPAGPIPELDGLTQRIRVGANVQAANLIKKVQPTYPDDAKSRHVQGTILFTAVIDEQGNIANLTFADGPLALYRSARDAVRQWVYKPTLLNGRPVSVITRIDVNFVLSR
jgi:hypothetical protein